MASAIPQNTLEMRRLLDAPRERVFRAWTDLETIKKWWGPGGFTLPEAEQDLRVGGAFRFVMRSPEGTTHSLRGQYREIQPPAKLVLTWNWEHDKGAHETVVTIELIARGKQTELVLTHGPFPNKDGLENHNRGWTSQLERLPAIL